jgi:hypothetical protein
VQAPSKINAAHYAAGANTAAGRNDIGIEEPPNPRGNPPVEPPALAEVFRLLLRAC